MMPANGQQQAELIQGLADQAVERFPAASLESLAIDLEVDAAEHPETSETGIAIAMELRLRAAAGVRKWPTTSNTGSSADDDFELLLAAAIEGYCAEVVANRNGLDADDVRGGRLPVDTLDEESETDGMA